MLSVSELKIGDIMTFDGERDENGKIDSLSHLIMILTDSEVSHGALFLQHNPSALADAGLSGLHAHLVSDTGDVLRPVHICRLKSADFIDLTPVIEVANKYIDENLVYPMPDLILLGMILVYKNISHVSLKQKVVIKLLKLITAKIKSILEDKLYDGKHAMICSEFVYQCYLDAAKEHPELKLVLKNGDLQASLRQRTSVTLLDYFIDQVANKKNEFIMDDANVSGELSSESETDLIQMAIDGIHEENVLFQKNNELSNAIQGFLVAQQRLRGTPVYTLKGLIKSAKDQEAFFVTPNDLLCHIANADNLGKFEIYRKEEIFR